MTIVLSLSIIDFIFENKNTKITKTSWDQTKVQNEN